MVQKLSGEPQILIILYGHNINIIYKAGSFNFSQKLIAQKIFFVEPLGSVEPTLGTTALEDSIKGEILNKTRINQTIKCKLIIKVIFLLESDEMVYPHFHGELKFFI